MDLAKNIKLLAGELDWPIWKRKIRDLLDYHEGALDAIDGILKKPEPLGGAPKPEEISQHKEKCNLYRKANSYAKSMITSTVTDAVYQKIMDKETAHDTWNALRQQFEATSKDQLFKICTDLFAFTWNSAQDVSTHIAKLRSLWNELNNGLKTKNERALPELMLVCKVLHILPNTFETFRSSWMLLTKDEDKTFDELTMQLCMYERNFKSREDDNNLAQEALVARYDKKKQEVRPKSSGTWNKKEDTCNFCKKKGHWVRDCRKWIAEGRPTKGKMSSSNQGNVVDTNASLVSVCNKVYATELNLMDWWIDNGATRHVTNCPDWFVDFEVFESACRIQAAGKETLSAVGRGTIIVESTHNSKQVTLNEVWYVPTISRNLFSVLAAQDRNRNSIFKSSATKCWLEVEGKTVLCGSRQVNGSLYKAAIKPIVSNVKSGMQFNVAVEDDTTLQLYHERWGHQDKRHVKQMLEKELGIKVKLDKNICEPCIYGKAHRLPFGTRRKATAPGELMSTDVCGPFNNSFKKKKYLVVFKDSFTKFRYGFAIEHKSDVKIVLKEVIAHAKSLGHSIKELLSDNGGEFDNAEVKQILRSNGITQRLTAPYTPEQNGGSERENRTLVEMARTFKYSSTEVNYPEEIWAELTNSAVYILNRTGKSSVDGVSPYELWIGKKPRIKHFRIIGSTCFTHIPVQKRKKMDRKAIKGYLVGYDGDERYRIYIKEENKVILSRDVKFQENPIICEKAIKLPFRDVESTTQEQLEEPENAGGSIYSDEYETGRESSSESEESEENDIPQQQVNERLRNRSVLRKPKNLNDYVMAAEDFVNSSSNPETYQEAINSKEKFEWRKAMEREMTSLKENQTWRLTPLPKGSKAIPCKWVYCLKKNPDGSIDKFKARLVAKGFSQREGIDYSQTFSPVAKLGTIRSVLSIAASEKMHLIQFDVSTAFLYGDLEEIIYMKQPEGYEDGSDKVCELKKSLYGLKQSSRCWNKRFGSFISKLGFRVSDADPCLYMRERNGKKIILVLYVDDGLVASTEKSELDVFIEELRNEFKIVSKKASFFLGLQIEQKEDGIKVSQEAHSRKILERFQFQECKPISTPMVKTSESTTSGKEENQEHNFPYRQAVGAIMYLMLGTRPDLAYSIGFLSRSLENPTKEDVTRVKRVFRYIAGTLSLGIEYRQNFKRGILECYSDADFGGCKSTGRSTSGVVVVYAGGAISWLSQRQAMVATSTTEAEIVAANEAAKEIIWLCRLFNNIIQLKETPVLQVDNSAAVRLAQNPEFHRRTKHIATKHFFIREKVTEGKIEIQQVSTEKQIADIMTKPLPCPRLKILCSEMGLL